MLSVLWSSTQWDDQTIFHCSNKLLLIDNKMLGEVQCLSLASFCINHWVPLATAVLPIPFRDESFSHVPRSWASRDKKWLTLMRPDCQSLTFLQKFLLFWKNLATYLVCACMHSPWLSQSCPTLCDPVDCSPPSSSIHGDSPGKNTGVGWHDLLPGIFPTQGSNPGLLHCTPRMH